MDPVLLLVVALLAFANGANDISRGIATLVGSGVTSLRGATVWGVLTTALGSVAAVIVGGLLLKVFSTGLLADGADPSRIALAVACGASLWLLFTSLTGLPVSTTHAIVGGIVGAGMAEFGSRGIAWAGLGTKAALPLLLSPLIAFGLAFLIFPLFRRSLHRARRYCVCVREERLTVLPSGTVAFVVPTIELATGTTRHCESDDAVTKRIRIPDLLHFFSSGLTSFARGLNDTPKITALLLGVVVAGMEGPMVPFAIVGTGILAGGILAGRRVTRTLSHRITSMDPVEGVTSNVITALMVSAGTVLGLPFSTTHVSTSSIVGIGVIGNGHVNGAVVRDILFAWLVTLPSAAAAAFAVQSVM